jgi:hypothetical protein
MWPLISYNFLNFTCYALEKASASDNKIRRGFHTVFSFVSQGCQAPTKHQEDSDIFVSFRNIGKKQIH